MVGLAVSLPTEGVSRKREVRINTFFFPLKLQWKPSHDWWRDSYEIQTAICI